MRNEEEQLEFEKRRRGIIGGSDCGAIMQVEGCRDIMKVWRSKVEDDFKVKDKMAFRLGNYLENFVIELYEEATGRVVVDRQRFSTLKNYDFIGCHIDGVSLDKEDARTGILLEAKTSRSRNEWGDPWTDEVPIDILFQANHNMMVTGFKECHIPVFFKMDETFDIYVVKYDDFISNKILEREVFFWNNHVLTKIPPVVEENRVAIPESSRIATTEIVDDICEYRSVSSQLRVLEAKKKVLRSKLNQFIGAYEKLTFDGKTLATYKSFEKSSFDKEKFYVEHPALAEKYTKKVMYSQLRIK